MSKETLNEQPIEKIFNHIGKCCLDKLNQPHYSDKGGHKERSDYWKQVRKDERTIKNNTKKKS